MSEPKPTPNERPPKVNVDLLPFVDERCQKFFAQMAEEARKPHHGEHGKQFTRALLIRAQEAGLYIPSEEKP